MIMNISKGRWSKFKQEFPTIIFISTIHVWGCFNFPAYMRLGFPWSTIVAATMSVFGVTTYVIMFSSPRKFVFCLKFEQIDETLFGGHILKKIMPIWVITVYHVTMLVMWYKNFYHMPGIYYAILYIYSVAIYILLFRAASRNPKINN